MEQEELKSYHVWIFCGAEAGSTDIMASSHEDARQRAQKMWGIPAKHIAVHFTSRCPENGCDG